MQANTFPLTLKDAYMISRHVKHFIFKTAPGAPLEYIPGQFITLHFEHQDKKLHRSYSLANPPASSLSSSSSVPSVELELAAGYVEGGPGTTLLFQLKPGDIVHATGPFGRLILKETPPKRYIFVATSTGITPYRAMLPLLAKQLAEHPTLEVVILQGVRTAADALYHQEFITFAETNPRITYRAQLSQKAEPVNQPYEHIGYVQNAFPDLQLKPENDIVYLCGNPSMVDSAFTLLKEQLFPPQHIIREKYISR